MIDLRNIDGSSGIISRKITSVVDDQRGINAAFKLDLPDFESAIYYCAPETHWPVACCRIHPFVTNDLNTLFEGGCLLLLETSAGYLGVLPLADEESFCWLQPENGGMNLRAGTLGRDEIKGEKNLCVWAKANNPYQVYAETFKLASEVIPSFKLRETKEYGEMFKYLGWCSWEEYHLDINEKLLRETVDKINASPAPVRFMLVDDGHQNYDPTDEYFMRRLRSYSPDPDKFPAGYGPLLDKAGDTGIKWFGLWFPFMGGMIGLNPEDNDFDGFTDSLLTLPTGGAMPEDDQNSADRFMDGLLGGANGFDFIKVDFMSFPLAYYSGTKEWQNALKNRERTPIMNPHRASWRMNRALEAQLTRHQLQLLNCNAQDSFNFFNASFSNVSRCSCDYHKGKADKAREHLFQSYANIPWQGQFTWCDHDMFHSSDALCARMMAVSKALSGGPVYLSDAPEDFAPENIMPLCYEDGELVRPLAPAAPLPDSLKLEYPTAAVQDVSLDGNIQPYRVIAPLANDAAAIAVYHLAGTEKMIEAEISTGDYSFRDIMTRDPELKNIPTEGLTVWDWYDRIVFKLYNLYSFELQPLDDRLLILSPINQGWSVLGRFDKFLGPATVEVEEISQDQLKLVMRETGPLAVWLEHGEPVSPGLGFKTSGNGLYVAEMPIGERNREIVISRKD